MQRTPLNVVDAFILHLHSTAEPWSVQLEMRCEGRLDPQRLAVALRAAIKRHPLARARLVDWKASDSLHHWEIADEPDHLALEVVDCGDSDALANEARARLQSFAPSLEFSPPLAVTLAHHNGGDYLMLNVSHVAGDGLSSFRLMKSILRSYVGLADPVPDIDPLEARNLFEIAGSRTLKERIARARTLTEHIRENLTPPISVAKAGGTDARGYGFHLIPLGVEGTSLAMANRVKPATVNDLLLAGLAVTINRWNSQHRGRSGRIGIMMPVNLRPPTWQYEVLGNFASYLTASVDTADQSDLKQAMAAIAEQTARFKEAGSAAQLIDFLQVPNLMPAAIKNRLKDFTPLSGGTVVSTAVLSNLGKQDPLPHLGPDGGAVTEMWFSPPGHMPMGTSVGAAFMNGKLFLTLRYRRPQFGAAEAAQFAEMYRSVLTETPV